MNFLGHLYFSDNNLELMYANLFGDFVKGKNYGHYSKTIQYGIKLHRTIDSYIDNHPAVTKLKRKLYTPLPKISGIAIDLYFDHILAANWNEFHNQPIDSFLDNFHKKKLFKEDYNSPVFLFLIDKMKEGRWLYHYKSAHGLNCACLVLSKRISFPNALHEAPGIFVKFEKDIHFAFKSFMSDAIPYFESYHKKIND
jgi:acyl carrier protein phosphodiesterase